MINKHFSNFAFYTFAFLIQLACTKKEKIIQPPAPETFLRGVDLSFTPEIRTTGTTFKYKNIEKDLVVLFKEKGINTVRLRLWYSPTSIHSSLSEVMQFSKEIKSKGMNIFLDIHYSDSWADPGKQTKPLAWKNVNSSILKDSVYAYTRRVVQLLTEAGSKPMIVQIGNETNGGFLWDDGRVGGSYDSNWPNYASLVKQGIKAVKDVDPSIKTMIHFAGFEDADWFYKKIKDQGIDYDYIGISYYPMFHGKDLDRLYQKLSSLVTTFNKPLVIAETSYPFTLGWNDFTQNLLGLTNQIIPSYPASVDGQAQFITALIKKIKALPNNRGLGLFYWAPDWVAYRGNTATNGSSAENQALFDFSNNALPALDSLGKAK